MPDVLHWLGIQKVDILLSMSDTSVFSDKSSLIPNSLTGNSMRLLVLEFPS